MSFARNSTILYTATMFDERLTSRLQRGTANGCNRRFSPTPARPAEGLLSDHIAGVRPVWIRPANSGQPIAFATRGCPQVMAENGVCHVVG